MSKIAFLMPQEEMVRDAQAIAEERHLEIGLCRCIHTSDAVNETRNALMSGARIIVARGYQAILIREYSNIPLVEIRLTGQEIGLLIKKAISLTGKKKPYIALIVFRNMVPDLSHMEELFDIRFRVFYIDRAIESLEILEGMKGDRPDCIIGGDICNKAAQEQGYMTLFYASTRESVEEAVDAALHLDQVLMQRQQEEAQIETILDASFNGIVRVNQDGAIIVVNHFIENLIGMDSESAKGKHLSDLLPQISMDQVASILSGEKEQLSTAVNFKQENMMAMMAPIEVEGQITGAIISIQRGGQSIAISRKSEQEMLLRGFVTRQTFENIRAKSAARRAVLDQARIFAMSRNPILIELPHGMHAMQLAKAIHNSSACRIGPYVSLDMAIIPEEDQERALFGSADLPADADEGGREATEGAMLLANHGSLYLRNVEYLSKRMQMRIVRSLQPLSEIRTDAQRISILDTRLIVSCRENFQEMMQEGRLAPDFYFLLNALVLRIPMLRECPEDLERLLEEEIRDFCKLYHRNLHLTAGARARLLSYPWEGNEIQVKAFAERLVMQSKKRVVDEVATDQLYEELYPKLRMRGGQVEHVVYRSAEGDRIEELLRQYVGNRKEVARELGISTTTLWRKMKKYGIGGLR